MALFGVALVAGAGTARAEGEEKGGEKMPLPLAERPLTLPKMTLAPELGFGVSHFNFDGFNLGTTVGVDIGAHFGILDDLEVGAVVLPVKLSPDFGYENPQLEATFRFVKGKIELGARVRTLFVTEKSVGGVVVEAGVPVLIHVSEAARIDTGAFALMSFGSGVSFGGEFKGGKTAGALRIPFQFIYDVIPPLHVGVQTGFAIADLSDAGHKIYVPLGVVAGYAIGNEKGPLVDIDPYFTFPYFATPGVPSPGDKINAGAFQTGLAATVFLYL
jgi:hypothetical protein